MAEQLQARQWGRPGIYNREYFTGAQVALYIGDVLVDEVVALNFQVQQSVRPIYGYASQLWDDTSKGQVLVNGVFSVNFKEAGYLWLILNEYKRKRREIDLLSDKEEQADYIVNHPDLGNVISPFRKNTGQAEHLTQDNIERIINNETGVLARNQALTGLLGFASEARAQGRTGTAEGIYEAFENYVWGGNFENSQGFPQDVRHRRSDTNVLQGFDIYVAFGDYVGDDNINHTVHMLRDIHITGSGKQIDITGDPIREWHSFIAREII